MTFSTMTFVQPHRDVPNALGTVLLPMLASALTGCASIVSGQTQVVSVDTPGCPQARCELMNDKGKWFVPVTPGTVSIGRSYNNLQVSCVKDGVSSPPVSVASTTKGMAFGNILFGGIIGAGVDVGSGAAYDYPQLITVPMQCDAERTAVDEVDTANAAPRLGLMVARPAAGTAQGVLVVGVDAGSPADRAGFKTGDVIVSANGATLADPEALATLISGLRAPWVLELVVRSDGLDTTRRIASPATPAR